jgi:hypothetical membrane protein
VNSPSGCEVSSSRRIEEILILTVPDRARLYARLAAAGIALYLALSVLLAFLRPRFSLLHNAESDYGSAGHDAWVMDIAFLVRGALSLAAVAALSLTEPLRRRTLGMALLAVWAVASALLAFFPDDPAGTPVHTAGRIHLVLAGVAFLAVAIGTIVVSRGLRPDPRWQSLHMPLYVSSRLAIVALLLLGHTHLRINSLGGLYERLFLGLELLWFLIVAIRIATLPVES